MTKYEFLKVNQSLLQVVADKGINARDVKNLALYEEYVNMSKQGLKCYYIAVSLADKYNISLRTVYKIVERMKAKVSV